MSTWRCGTTIPTGGDCGTDPTGLSCSFGDSCTFGGEDCTCGFSQGTGLVYTCGTPTPPADCGSDPTGTTCMRGDTCTYDGQTCDCQSQQGMGRVYVCG